MGTVIKNDNAEVHIHVHGGLKTLVTCSCILEDTLSRDEEIKIIIIIKKNFYVCT